MDAPVFAESVVAVPGVGAVTVTTYDFSVPGYEVCGFETVTVLPDGREFGTGPDEGETPAELHALCSNAAELARSLPGIMARL